MGQIVPMLERGDLQQVGKLKVRVKDDQPPFEPAFSFLSLDDIPVPERKTSGRMPREMLFAVARWAWGEDGTPDPQAEIAQVITELCQGRVCIAAGWLGSAVHVELVEDARDLADYFSDEAAQAAIMAQIEAMRLTERGGA